MLVKNEECKTTLPYGTMHLTGHDQFGSFLEGFWNPIMVLYSKFNNIFRILSDGFSLFDYWSSS